MRTRMCVPYLLLFALCLSLQPPSLTTALGQTPTAYEVTVQYNVKVRMRDGVGLATQIFRPVSPEKFPVIVVRDPYSNGTTETRVKEANFWASHGFVYVIQSVRGRYDSEGHYYPYIYEVNDGYDTQQWAGTQPWSNGRVGTIGGSYLATVQWMPAPLRSPHLKAMNPMVTPFNYYFDVMYPGGAFALVSRIGWGATMASRTNISGIFGLLQNNLTHLPLINMDEAIGLELPHWKDWIEHPSYDAYWKLLDVESQVSDIDVPSLNVGGWYDVFQRGTLTSHAKMVSHGRTAEARMGQKLIMGPWPHGLNTSTKTGDLDFGEESIIDLQSLQLRWMNHWLKGEETGIMDEAPVRIFVMGENKWRDEQAWPLERAQPTRYYLHSSGKANTPLDGTLSTRLPRQEPVDSYTYDPMNPVPTLGGNMLGGGGPREQGDVEPRSDVLTFQTGPLNADVEVTGPITVTLFAATSVRDTDFTAKLMDVHADGKVYNLVDGIIRARYRNSFTDPELAEPGAVYEYTIDLWATSNLFKKGHRIRLDISSSNFPRFNRNPNTGNQFGMSAEVRTADQTIYHDRERPSHVLLPVIPR